MHFSWNEAQEGSFLSFSLGADFVFEACWLVRGDMNQGRGIIFLRLASPLVLLVNGHKSKGDLQALVHVFTNQLPSKFLSQIFYKTKSLYSHLVKLSR